MKNLKSKLTTLIFIMIGIANSQTLTVEYVDGDDPYSEDLLFGEWELVDSGGNSQFFDSGDQTEVDLFENYTIIVSEDASTSDGGESDRWFLYYNGDYEDLSIQQGFSLSDEIDITIKVNYYHKVPIDFSVTDAIDSVFIDDPWDRYENGNLIEGFVSLVDWLENNEPQVFPGRGFLLEELEQPFYQLKAKRLVATAGTGNDGIYRADSWGGEAIEIHPV